MAMTRDAREDSGYGDDGGMACRPPHGRPASRPTDLPDDEGPAAGSAGLRCHAARSGMDVPLRLAILEDLRRMHQNRARAAAGAGRA